MVKQMGNIRLSQITFKIDYASNYVIMKFGLVGVKVWVAYKKVAVDFYRINFYCNIKPQEKIVKKIKI